MSDQCAVQEINQLACHIAECGAALQLRIQSIGEDEQLSTPTQEAIVLAQRSAAFMMSAIERLVKAVDSKVSTNSGKPHL